MIFVLSILLGSLCASPLPQETADSEAVLRKKVLMLEVGHTTFRDDYLNPMVYDLPTFGAIMKWEKSTTKSLVSKVLRYGWLFLKCPIT